MTNTRLVGILCFLAGLSGCAYVPGSTFVPPEKRIDNRHHHYSEPLHPSLEGSHLLGIPKLNPVWWSKNTDTPVPDWFMRDEPDDAKRRKAWLLRNPMHNFTQYVIGIGDRHFHQRGMRAGVLWNPDGGLNLTLSSCGPFIHLPFLSYRGRWMEFYLGWRERGNFGAALRKSDREKAAKKRERQRAKRAAMSK